MLKKSNHSVRMITGDAPLTAAHAPEAPQKASASTHRAISERMATAQRRFIEERDARLAVMKDGMGRGARAAESEHAARVARGEAQHKPPAYDTPALDTPPPFHFSLATPRPTPLGPPSKSSLQSTGARTYRRLRMIRN